MRRAAICGLLLVASAAGAARADNAKADEKFRLGKKLLAQKHYADACKAFEESNDLDPGIGAELNVGHCYEEWGKLGTAYKAYAAAEAMAEKAKDARLPKIRERLEALDPQVPRLTITVAKDQRTKGLVIAVDDEPLSVGELGKELRVDPGPHHIEYHLGSSPKRSKVIPLERGGSSEITLELPAADVAAAAQETEPARGKPGPKHTSTADQTEDGEREEPAGPAPGHGRRVGGVVAMGAGGVALGVAAVLTISARSKYRDALDAHCGGNTSMCDAAGLQSTHDARHEANIATVIAGAGAAVAIAGVILYVTAPHRARERASAEEATRLVPTASSDAAGLALFGHF